MLVGCLDGRLAFWLCPSCNRFVLFCFSMSSCSVNDEMAYLNEGMIRDENDGGVDNESYCYILH